ncbi:MAG: response regulator [Gammaproteobacteria bacterium]|nr:response regulator [Gammaproteobacteria bacterium]
MFNLWGIRNNILFLVLAPSLLASIVMSSYFVVDRIETLEATHLVKGKTILASLVLMTEVHTENDNTIIQNQLSKFRDSNRNILAIALINNRNDSIIKTGNDIFIKQLKLKAVPSDIVQYNLDDFSKISAPLVLANSSDTYYLSILLDRQPLTLESYHTIFIATIIALTAMSLSLVIALYLSRTIGSPLQKISDELEAINDGDLDITIHTPAIPELAKISSTINSLTGSLQQARDNMQHNVDQATSDLTQTLETIEIQNIELDMARKQAIQASRVKSEFLANISHEIRTPMNGVIGFTNLLLNSELDITQKDYLQTIRKSAYTLLSIIEDILDFSKIEAGKMTLEKVSFSLRDCVEEVIMMLTPSSVKKDIELIPLIYKNVPELLLGDPIRIKQVLTNLVSNAIKFTEKGSIVVRILLEDDNENSQTIRTTITDTGIGMTDEQVSKLFQPFSQVNQNINRHHSGTGLGLVISKKLVEQMGGEIIVESKSNEGTSFSYTIISEKLSQQEISISLPEQSVLVFDHHPIALLAMKQLLSTWDMKIYDFQTIDKLLAGIELISKSSNTKPIVMLGLADNNQYITNTLPKINSFPNKALIILGDNDRQFDDAFILEHGISQFIKKPLTRKQLIKTFEKVGIIDSNSSTAKASQQKSNQFSQLRILAVDDNPANLKLITIILEEMSIDVIQAYDGLSAIEICNEQQFDMIFMDIRMPGLDGIETSQRIKAESINQRTPIIALTAHAMTGEKEQLLANGLEDYMTKPVSIFQLEQLISKWTEQIAEPINELPAKNGFASTSSIDWDTCLEIAGGREKLAQEMLGDLLSAIPIYEQQLKDNSLLGDELLSEVHKLHGLACYTGVPKIRAFAAELEQELKTTANKKQVNKLRSALSAELANVQLDVSNFLQ